MYGPIYTSHARRCKEILDDECYFFSHFFTVLIYRLTTLEQDSSHVGSAELEVSQTIIYLGC